MVDDVKEKATGLYRWARNVVSGASEVEILVKDATNNDKWGPTGDQMRRISALTHQYDAFQQIMTTIFKRLNDNAKLWRHVYKALLLLDYLIKNGSSDVVKICLRNMHQIRTLREFQHVSDMGRDEGQNVRQRAKLLMDLLGDKERIRDERNKAKKNAGKFTESISSDGVHFGGGATNNDYSRGRDRGRSRDNDYRDDNDGYDDDYDDYGGGGSRRGRGRRSRSRSRSRSRGGRSRSRSRSRSPPRDRRRDREREKRRNERRAGREPSVSPTRGGEGGSGRPRAPSGDGVQIQQQQQQPQMTMDQLLFGPAPTQQQSAQANQFPVQQQQQQMFQQQPLQMGAGFNPRGPAVTQQPAQPALPALQPFQGGGQQQQVQQPQQQQWAAFGAFQDAGQQQQQQQPKDVVSKNAHLFNLEHLDQPGVQRNTVVAPTAQKKTLAQISAEKQGGFAGTGGIGGVPAPGLTAAPGLTSSGYPAGGFGSPTQAQPGYGMAQQQPMMMSPQQIAYQQQLLAQQQQMLYQQQQQMQQQQRRF